MMEGKYILGFIAIGTFIIGMLGVGLGIERQSDFELWSGITIMFFGILMSVYNMQYLKLKGVECV